MKKIILSMALALTAFSAGAAPRTPQQALAIAQDFVLATPQLSGVGVAKLSLAPTASVRKAKAAGQTSAPAYYVCNIENGGMVVVSGDDRFKEVLGYTTTGTFTTESELPDGLRYWLGFLAGEMDAAIEAGYEPVIQTRVQSYNASQSVEPLLTTKWNQNNPYNNKLNGNMTGCVATGIAQVMNFWKYPTTGSGSHTGAYSPNFSADFGATTYDWANMLDRYGTGWESKAEVEAVSTLMLHVGVATDMRWDKTASATPAAYGAYALHNYFKYNKNLYIESRDQLSLGAWKALLIDQLQTGHPLCYSGMDMKAGGAGHFFVCDGYDATNGKFHFNWGWAGLYDGYYEITSLEPGTGGIGAGAGSYDDFQYIFVNMQPTETGTYHANFDCTSVKFNNTTNKASVRIETNSLANNCAKPFKGTIGVAIYTTSGEFVKYIPAGINFPESGFHIGSNYSGAYTYAVDMRSVANGTYTVCAAVMSEDSSIHPVRAAYDQSTYYTMTMGNTSVQFAAQDNIADVSINSVELVSSQLGNMYQNQPSRFAVSVTNNSAKAFNDEIGVNINGGRGTNDYITVPATLAPGETKVIEVYGASSLTVKDGYTVKGCYGENGTYKVGGGAITVNMKPETDGIENVVLSTDLTDAPAYNIAGQRVSSAAKGIIIVGGRKYMK